MKTLFRESLSREIVRKCRSVKKRLWISSPFVGAVKSVNGILGCKYDKNIDLKLLVDTSDICNCNYQTINNLIYKGFNIRSLYEIHAKIYVFDDDCIVTSANLTENAFRRKNEIGISLNNSESKDAIKIFEYYYGLGETQNIYDDDEIIEQKKNYKSKMQYGKFAFSTETFYDIPNAESYTFVLPKGQIRQLLNNSTNENRVWKLSLGRRWAESNIYDNCIRTDTIAIGWLDDFNIANWKQEKILKELNKYSEDSAEKTQNTNSIYYFVRSIKKGDIILVYSNRKEIRAIGIIAGDYKWDDSYLGFYNHRREVKWLTYDNNINIYEINNMTNLSEMTLYELKKIDREKLNEIILSL